MCSAHRAQGDLLPTRGSSDEPLPASYTHPAAARLRETGGVMAKSIDREAMEKYLRDVNLLDAIAGLRNEAAKLGGLRQPYLTGMAASLETMFDLAMEVLGQGAPVPYARCVEASTASGPEPSNPETKRERVAELLGRAGYATSNGILDGVDAWRKDRTSPMASVRALGAAVIAHFDQLSAKNLLPYLPAELAPVPEPTSTSWPSRTRGSPVQ